MTNLLAIGAAWLRDQRKDHLSQTVEYRRGGDVLAILATHDLSHREIEDGEAGVIEIQVDDWLLSAEDLKLYGHVAVPKNRDLIVCLMGEEYIAYEVAPVGAQAAWEYEDPQQEILRIHTNRLGPATPPAADEEELS